MADRASLLRKTLMRPQGATPVQASPGVSLLHVMRSQLGAKAAARGCHDGSCGACRVFLEGKLVAACQVNWASVVDGSSLETYEDLSKEPAAQAAVQRFQKLRPTRCMLCVPGLAITAVDLCRRGRAGDEEAIEDSLQSTSCACTGRGSLRRSLLAGRG